MSTHSLDRRKKRFVNWRIQGRMLAWLAVYWVLYHAALWHGMFLCRYWQHRQVVLSGGSPLSLGEVYREFARDHWTLLAAAVALSPLIFWDMVKLTHRVAGPLVRFEQAWRSLAAGEEVPKMSLRPGDLTTGLQDAFNSYLDRLQGGDRSAAGRMESPATLSPDDCRMLLELDQIPAMLSAHSEELPAASRP